MASLNPLFREMVETRRPVHWAGPALILIGVLHTAVMILYPVYGEMLSAGLWNTVSASTYEGLGLERRIMVVGYRFMLVFAGLLCRVIVASVATSCLGRYSCRRHSRHADRWLG